MPSGGVKTGRTEVANMQSLFQALYEMGQLYNSPAGAAFAALIGNGSGLEQFQGVLEALGGLDIGGQYGNRGFNLPPELQPFLNSLATGTDRANDILNRQGQTPGSSYTGDRLTDILNFGVPGIDAKGQELMTNNGWSPTMAGLNEQAQQLMGYGGFTGNLMDLEKTGMGLVASQGRNQETGTAINQFLQNITNGGKTPETSQMFNRGLGLVNTNGFTPEMSQFMGTLMAKMNDNGMTPEARQVFDKAMGIVNNNGAGGALAPTDQVVSMARDAANTAMLQKAMAARREMNLRTGGAIGAGTAGDALASFSNEAAQAEAGAIREAVLTQQEQQLKQLLGMAGIASDTSKTASQLLGSLAGAGGDVMRSASANISTGAGMMSSAEQIAADRFKTSTAGFNSTLDTELQRMLAGSGMVNNANQMALSRLGLGMDTSTRLESLANAQLMNGMNSLMSNGQLRLGAADGLNRIFATQTANEMNALGALQGMASTGLNAGMQQQGVDLQALGQSISSQLQSLGLTGDIAQQIANQYLQGAGGLANLGGQYFGLSNTGLGNMGQLSNSLINAAMQPSMWQQLGMGALNAGIGALAGAGGSWLTRRP